MITTLSPSSTKITYVRYVTYRLNKLFSRDVATGFVMTAFVNLLEGELFYLNLINLGMFNEMIRSGSILTVFSSK